MTSTSTGHSESHLHHWPLYLFLSLFYSVRVPVQVTLGACLLSQLHVVRATQQANIVDEGNSWRKELNGARQQVPLSLIPESGQVGAIHLHIAKTLFQLFKSLTVPLPSEQAQHLHVIFTGI
jgi:hypothetical protein